MWRDRRCSKLHDLWIDSDGLDLAGRAALVTGASGGIGRAICQRLADHVAGIAVAYGSNAESAEALAAEIVSGGRTARAFGCDMTDPDDPQQSATATPLGRVGQPDEVADLALAIVRNGYVTSQVFCIDEGMYPR